MPIRRYFLVIGSLLVALLLLVDWYLPPVAVDQAQADLDRSTIRIHSARKWPRAVVFDTTQPTVAAPVSVAGEPAPPARSAQDALAMATAETAKTAEAKQVKAEPRTVKRHVRRTRVARRSPSRFASYQPFGFTPFWSNAW
jgi:hypothetical protein